MDANPTHYAARICHAAALVVLLLLVAGCTSFGEYVHNGFKVGPDYLRPAAPVAKDWIDANDVRVRDESADLSNWWQVFGDPVLDGLMTRAYEQNLTLREAGFRVLQARAQLGIAVGMFFPQQQDAFGDYTRHAASRANANTGFLTNRFYDQWDVGFNLAWELDFWGRYRRAIESADADLDASVENYDDALVTLLGDVAATYVRMRQFEVELQLVRANVELQRHTLAIADARFKGGTASKLDVEQATSNLEQTDALVPQFEILVRQSNNGLCILLGMPPEDLQALLGARDIPVAPIDVSAGVPAELLARRPDVRRAERMAAAQSALVGVATSELYPHISIIGTIGASAQKPGDLFTPPALVGAAPPGFTWNVLNYGRLLNNIRLQDAKLQELVVAYQETVLNAANEVENGLVAFLRSQQRATSLAKSVAASERAVQISLAEYRGGTIDFNRVALLEQNLVQQQDLQAQARGAIALGLIDVYRALGGGWQIRLAPAETLPQVPQPPWGGNPNAPEPIPPPTPDLTQPRPPETQASHHSQPVASPIATNSTPASVVATPPQKPTPQAALPSEEKISWP